MNDLRELPSIDQLLTSQRIKDLVRIFGRPLVLEQIRIVLQKERLLIKQKKSDKTQSELIKALENQIQEMIHPGLTPVINATGVILHTNLGRACLSDEAVRAVEQVGRAYSTLEYDLSSGERGNRAEHVAATLESLLGVEDAFIVNNNAGAVLLVLAALASRKRVIVSRTQLIEIGGGFRIPEVLKQSGAKMVEIGTTNQVHIQDYIEELKAPTAVVLQAHRSNFKLVGFSGEPPLKEIVAQAHNQHALVVDDVGSGALLDTSRYGLEHEPMVQESLAAGADIVCFSGDKLLGGPQAGILVGKKDLLKKIKKHPLARALRADKLMLAGLHITLLHYLKDEATRSIPTWRMIAMDPGDIHQRALSWRNQLGQGEVVESESTVGGGSLPGENLPTFALALNVKNTERFLAKIRQADTPVIARVTGGKILFDPRTVMEDQDRNLVEVLKKTADEERRT